MAMLNNQRVVYNPMIVFLNQSAHELLNYCIMNIALYFHLICESKNHLISEKKQFGIKKPNVRVYIYIYVSISLL